MTGEGRNSWEFLENLRSLFKYEAAQLTITHGSVEQHVSREGIHPRSFGPVLS